MPLLELIGSLGTIAGAHGVGQIDVVERRTTRSKRASAKRRQAPLHAAHKNCASRSREPTVLAGPCSVDADAMHRHGIWFSPLRDAFDVAAASGRVTGVVRLKLFKGDYRSSAEPRPARPTTDDYDHRLSLMTTLWSGRFDAAPDAAAFEFGSSFGFDRRLFEDDVTGSLAWAARSRRRRAVGRRRRRRSMPRSTDDSRARPRATRHSSPGADEDVHSFVERQLVERLGDAGRRLHTGRSRNEQVSLDLRLYLRRRIPLLQRARRGGGRRARRAGAQRPATR